jgi:ketosteroid isomerase-like protein
MKILLAGIALTASLVACGSDQNSAAQVAQQVALQRSADTLAIGQIEVTWHKAASTKDVNLMMTIWADTATFTVGTVTYTGKDQIRNFFATKAAPFKPENNWISETPAYKTRVTVNGDSGTLYFECHYVDVATRTVKAVVGADVTVARINGRWLMTNSVSATPVLSAAAASTSSSAW